MCRDQAQGPVASFQVLHGDLAIEADDDDLSVAGFALPVYGEQIPVQDAGVPHAFTAYPKQVIGRRCEKVSLDRAVALDALLRQ